MSNSQFTSPVKTRSFRFVKSDYYIYKNTCLLKLLKVRKTRELSNLQLVINGVKINPSKQDKVWAIWDFNVIRAGFRETLGFTPEENTLIALEEMLFYNEQTIANKHYTKLTLDELQGSVMTSGLQVALSFRASTIPTYLEAEETVYISDVHEQAYGEDAKQENV